MPSDERSAFEELALPHLPLLYRVARRLVRDEHAAEDLVQETYLRALKAFSSVEVRGYGLKSWLLKILNNAFLNRAARENRSPRLVEQDTLEQSAGGSEPGAGAPEPLDYEYVDEEVKRAIDELPEEFRTVLLMWATMEFSYKEIAEILEVPMGTVMSRLYRARQGLSRTLERYARASGRIRSKTP